MYKTIITKVGLEKIKQATTTKEKVDIIYMAFGDGGGENPQINENMTELLGEKYRGTINNIVEEEQGLVYESIIPANVGGFSIREVGLIDVDGDLIAIGTFPSTYKSSIDEGATSDLTGQMVIAISNTEAINLEIDPNITVATKADLNRHIDDVVTNEDGVHGIRISNGTIQFLDKNGEWSDASSQGEPIPVGKATEFNADMVTGTVHLTFKDPEDFIVQDLQGHDIVVSRWKETVIVRKEGDKPSRDVNDGIVILRSNVRNQYETDPYVDVDVDDNTTYTYTIFTVSRSGGINEGESLEVIVLDVDPVPTKPVQRLELKGGDGFVEIRVDDPDTEEWISTRVVRTIGQPAISPREGDLVFDNRIRDKYKDTPFIDKNVENDQEYFYTAFTTSNTGGVAQGIFKKVTPASFKIFGVEIDESNANPETRVKYIDDAVGFKPVRGNNGNTDWGSWKDTFIYEKFKPCVVKNGEVQYYLNKEDFTKKEDGTPSKLTGADGDVMIEIDKMWVKLNKVGDKQYIRVSDAEHKDYQCLAHTNGDEEVDKIYVGAYLGYEQSDKLRSISGVEPTGSKTIGVFRNIAEANGDRYHQVPFYPLTLLQSVMTIMLKSTDTQAALGRGHVDDSGSYSKTGNTNRKGMMFGETGGQANSGQMCFMGIEDFWGNKRWWIDGCKYDGGSIKTATTNFNDNAAGYRAVGNYSTGGGFIESVKGDNNTGFIPDRRDGSNSTHYCDSGHVRDGLFPLFGGYRSRGSDAGGFALSSYSDSYSSSNLGSRLFMYGKSIK